MSPRLIGIGLLVVVGEVIGIFTASVFYKLFLRSVPPLSMSELNTSAAHGMFYFYGVILGLVLAFFCLMAIVLSRFFGPRATA